jgi:bacteriorhodopsin
MFYPIVYCISDDGLEYEEFRITYIHFYMVFNLSAKRGKD